MVFSCRIAWSMHLGYFSIFPGGSSFFTLSESLETSCMHGSRNSARKPFGIPLFQLNAWLLTRDPDNAQHFPLDNKISYQIRVHFRPRNKSGRYTGHQDRWIMKNWPKKTISRPGAFQLQQVNAQCFSIYE